MLESLDIRNLTVFEQASLQFSPQLNVFVGEIATGSLLGKGYLFWDEPETNLNSKWTKGTACTILHLRQSGVQVFVATHSLFLMRELHILLHTSGFNRTEARFFGLQRNGDAVEVEQGPTVDDIRPITSLDEELNQSDRYLVAEG